MRTRTKPDELPHRVYERRGVRIYSIGYKAPSGAWLWQYRCPVRDASYIELLRQEATNRAQPYLEAETTKAARHKAIKAVETALRLASAIKQKPPSPERPLPLESLAPTSFQLYRNFDKAATLLYVGVSFSAIVRLFQHKKDSRWFDQIHKVEISHWRTRADLLIAEKNAIQLEAPIFNKVYNKRAA